MGVADGAVYYLPSSGAVENGAFCEDSQVKARRLASSLGEFLILLNGDVAAFVRNDEAHEYLTTRG